MNDRAVFRLVFPAAFLAAAVLGPAHAADAAGGDAGVAFTTLAQGALSGITTATRTVIRDPASWETLWRAHTAPFVPAPPLPVVDFAQQAVLAVVLGSRGSGGYAVAVTEVRAGAAPAPLTVLVRETRPARGSIAATVMTSPYHFVAIPFWDRSVQFGVLDDVVPR